MTDVEGDGSSLLSEKVFQDMIKGLDKDGDGSVDKVLASACTQLLCASKPLPRRAHVWYSDSLACCAATRAHVQPAVSQTCNLPSPQVLTHMPLHTQCARRRSTKRRT
mgnify:CR=1 FL=1